MHELAMALIRDLNFTTAAMVIGVVVGASIWLTNRRWAIANEHKAELEHETKMYELETERTVKTQRLSEYPAVENDKPVIEHRRSDRDSEGSGY